MKLPLEEEVVVIGDDFAKSSCQINVGMNSYFSQFVCSKSVILFLALNIVNRLCHGGFRRLAFGMYFLSMPFGHILALVIISLGWYPENGYFMDISVEIYFFVLAALMLVNACFLAIVIYKMVDIPSRLVVE